MSLDKASILADDPLKGGKSTVPDAAAKTMMGGHNVEIASMLEPADGHQPKSNMELT